MNLHGLSEGICHMHTALPVLQHHPQTWPPVDRYPENIVLLSAESGLKHSKPQKRFWLLIYTA